MKVYNEIDEATFVSEFNTNGYVVVRSGLDEKYLDEMRGILRELIEVEKEIVAKEDYQDYGFLLCAPFYADKYPQILDVFRDTEYLERVRWILEKWFIVYLYTNNAIRPFNGINKAVRIHVDTPRLIPGYNVAVATLITLDDFTEENGATWYLRGSHLMKEQPEAGYFYEHAERLVVPKGSIFYFNPRLWHAGGKNASENWRNSIIVAYSKPWMKQRVDIPRFTAHLDKASMPEELLQLLGYRSQPPANFDEFYGEPGDRSFTQPFV